ncbi:hypothetical protein PoB_002624500 [Plakobranchus ocellatus]|uniref:Uncharacterized protein n=1 Tax=Plakobranchus ocellatus TaxID=259542 RepID=A0AAV3ZV60_9GAST|nr:hypothetical protein PoB_002624500 [Plakobranchus ocellatus]
MQSHSHYRRGRDNIDSWMTLEDKMTCGEIYRNKERGCCVQTYLPQDGLHTQMSKPVEEPATDFQNWHDGLVKVLTANSNSNSSSSSSSSSRQAGELYVGPIRQTRPSSPATDK